MRSPRSWLVWVLLSCVSGPLAAHDVPPSIVMIDIGHNTLDLEVQLQLSELGAALRLPLASSPGSVLPRFGPQIERYVEDSLQVRAHDGRAYTQRSESLAMRHTNDANWTSNDWLVVHTRLQAPDGASTETFSLDYSVILRRVVSHKALIYVRRDVRNGLLGDRPLLIGVMGFGSTHLDVDGSDGSWWHGFGHLFSLGMKHIAEGSDHLLFLITLLLPTPLIASARRWRHRKSVTASARTIVGVVSGFTLGHSLTLGLGSSGWVVLPARAVEVAIAISILVSSIHAWRPLFPGKEAWIAATFGLIHGLAFAEVLSGLNFDGWTLALSLLGFNLGIESMQLLVIAATLPPLILLSSTRYYTGVRLVGAGFAAVCAVGWILERAFELPNPLAPVANWLAAPPTWLVAAVCVASALSIGLLFRRAPSYRTPTWRSVCPARLSLRSANRA